ncbi:MAG: hypothetical protein LBF60_06015, partial [Treponema sp.]|nr:hypothetical protein [Treponema sp.]
AQAAAAAGDTVYIRGGTYYIGNDIGGSFTNSYMTAFLMEKSGEEKSDGGVNRINYFGYPEERPVFDMSGFDRNTGATSSGAASGRFAAFMIKGSYLHFKNFEAIGLRARFLS